VAKNPDDAQLASTSVTTYADGSPVKTVTKTPLENPDKRTTKEKVAAQRTAYLQKLGVYQAFLEQNPDIEALIKRAIKDYKNGDVWTDERFQAEYSTTKFAQDRSKSEEEFDLGMGGANADTYIKRVNDMADTLRQTAGRLGVPLTEEQVQAKAREAVRSNLSTTAVDLMWAQQYESLTNESEADKIAGEGIAGTAGNIQTQLKDWANAYGLKIDESLLRKKTSEGLGQGERWQEWMQGQQDFFKQQAKLMYPNAANLLETQTLQQIAEPYFSEAADMLGITSEQMMLSDPKWTGFLNGPDGKILSRDEWVRVIRTDPKYEWDKSQNARQDYSRLTDGLFAAFGMA
jgi:hypothetical protein